MASGESGGNVDDVVRSILDRFGVSKDHGAVLDAVKRVLQRRKHAVEIVSLRHGELVVQSDARGAQLLNWDRDSLLAEIENTSPGSVSKLVVRVRR